MNVHISEHFGIGSWSHKTYSLFFEDHIISNTTELNNIFSMNVFS